jgi:S-adenosylmethionine decarboxylase
MKQVGQQVIVDVMDCAGDFPHNEQFYHDLLRKIAAACFATVESTHVHLFQPYGVSALAILSESHISLHTYPEYRYLSVDIYTCGVNTNPSNAIPIIGEVFSPGNTQVITFSRGISLPDSFRHIR